MMVGAVSGWRDGLSIVQPCVDSILERGLSAYYLDGAYSTYCFDPKLSATPAAELPTGHMLDIGTGLGRPWRSEAEKRTRLVLGAVEEPDYEDEFILVMDADERLEGDVGELIGWAMGRPETELWWTVSLYWPTVQGSLQRLPRLLRYHPSLEFRGHRDWQLWREGRRIAPVEGDPAFNHEEADGLWAPVPWEVARLRHDRHERPAWRRRMSARYSRLHGAAACRGDADGVHAYEHRDGWWECGRCISRMEAYREEVNLESQIEEESEHGAK